MAFQNNWHNHRLVILIIFYIVIITFRFVFTNVKGNEKPLITESCWISILIMLGTLFPLLLSLLICFSFAVFTKARMNIHLAGHGYVGLQGFFPRTMNHLIFHQRSNWMDCSLLLIDRSTSLVRYCGDRMHNRSQLPGWDLKISSSFIDNSSCLMCIFTRWKATCYRDYFYRMAPQRSRWNDPGNDCLSELSKMRRESDDIALFTIYH